MSYVANVRSTLIVLDKTSTVLHAQLAKAGHSIEIGVELLRFEQFPDHVEAHIVNALGE